MDSRRDFIKKAALLSGAAGMNVLFPDSIARAFQINPAPGTTWKDAEHVVILMQENRSFDHCYGSLRGVRGFNDPRAIRLPSNDKVWLQSNSKGETFVPFRLNIHDTKATWMGSLPHGWTDQVDARSEGRYDQWLEAKKPGREEYRAMPLTLGYYTREDIPFYYALADAFTICDQNFCSSLTGTTPNRLYLWTGTIRENAQSQARVRNEETDYGVEASWRTFPERLEENGVSWKIYQNEISVGVGFEGEEDAWLANFTDNPLEWFEQYQVRFHPAHRRYLPERVEGLTRAILEINAKLQDTEAGGEEGQRLLAKLGQAEKLLAQAKSDLAAYTEENFQQLPAWRRSIHERAFTTNHRDPDYHTLATHPYDDAGTQREMKIPKGDILRQFREDVASGKLPTVSWLVAPENFSDHPGAPWYGAWYLSETLDILTKNPEVWKKTIFILCYDENDGYFDHVPPFVPPVPGDASSGAVSPDIDIQTEYVRLEDDLKRKSPEQARGGPIGLGYRVPLVIASPWSRGGTVCSQVFDHTSILQFLEQFTSHRSGKTIREENISSWRRTVCGDLTSGFKPYQGERIQLPDFLDYNKFVEGIHRAQFRQLPSGFHALSRQEKDEANTKSDATILPSQEKGTRPASALPYELYVDGNVSDAGMFMLTLRVGNAFFGERSAGSPFMLYSYHPFFSVRSYAVSPGNKLTDGITLDLTRDYHFSLYGPNGFFRQFKGRGASVVQCVGQYRKNSKSKTAEFDLSLKNTTSQDRTVKVVNHYSKEVSTLRLKGQEERTMLMATDKTFCWYDVSVIAEEEFEFRYAGHIETGKESQSDPAMA